MTEAQEDKIIKFTQDYYKYGLLKEDNFCIKKQIDYDDKLQKSEIEDILSASNPEEYFSEIIAQLEQEDFSEWNYQGDFWLELKNFCEKENEGIDEDSKGYLDFEEAEYFIMDNFTWVYPVEELYNFEFTAEFSLSPKYGKDFIKSNISMEKTDGDDYEELKLIATVTLQEAISIIGKKYRTITFKKGTVCNCEAYYENDGYTYCVEVLNRDTTINCKDIQAIHYEDSDTDWGRIVLGEKIKESNHRRFSNKLKEGNEYDEKYNNSIDKILTEAIIKCINLVCLLKDDYTENDRRVKNLIDDINRDKRYLSDETNSFLPRTLYKDYISDILDMEIDNADNNDDEERIELLSFADRDMKTLFKYALPLCKAMRYDI